MYVAIAKDRLSGESISAPVSQTAPMAAAAAAAAAYPPPPPRVLTRSATESVPSTGSAFPSQRRPWGPYAIWTELGK